MNFYIVQDYDSDDSSRAQSNSTKSKKSSPSTFNKPLLAQTSNVHDDRLFSTGLHGQLIEHDFDNLDKPISDYQYSQEKQRIWSVTSGAAWCMSFNFRAGRLAVGTEEGMYVLGGQGCRKGGFFLLNT